MSCDGHPVHQYEPGDCDYCGHPRDEHEGGWWHDPAEMTGKRIADAALEVAAKSISRLNEPDAR